MHQEEAATRTGQTVEGEVRFAERTSDSFEQKVVSATDAAALKIWSKAASDVYHLVTIFGMFSGLRHVVLLASCWPPEICDSPSGVEGVSLMHTDTKHLLSKTNLSRCGASMFAAGNLAGNGIGLSASMSASISRPFLPSASPCLPIAARVVTQPVAPS